MDEIWKERFIERTSRQGRAWHKKGVVKPADTEANVTDWFIEAGLNYGIVVVPQFIDLTASEFVPPEYRKILNTGRLSIFRLPTKDDPQLRCFGETSDRWEAVQNMTLATYFDPVSKYYPIETAGALGQGDRVFFSLKADPFSVILPNGERDELETYILVMNDHRPGKALIVAVVTVRPVCNNTIQLGLKSARFSLNISHTSGVNAMTEFAGKALAQIGSAQHAVQEAMQMLALKTIDQATANKAIEIAYPMPKRPKILVSLDTLTNPATTEQEQVVDGFDLAAAMREKVQGNEVVWEKAADSQEAWEYRVKRTEYLRETAQIALDYAVTNDHMGLTGYAVINALSEAEQHRTLRRGDVEGDMLWGARAQTLMRASDFLINLDSDQK